MEMFRTVTIEKADGSRYTEKVGVERWNGCPCVFPGNVFCTCDEQCPCRRVTITNTMLNAWANIWGDQ